ncbi:MAG: hypothetical protein ACXWCM_10800 [Acidimicrobiales bacterium]
MTPGDLPRTGTLGALTRRRWTTIIPRAVLLLVLIGSLAALGIAVAVVVTGLVLAATAG